VQAAGETGGAGRPSLDGGRRRRRVLGLAGVFGVAVRLLLAVAGGEAGAFAAADDAAVAFPNAGAEAAEDFAILVAPAPYPSRRQLVRTTEWSKMLLLGTTKEKLSFSRRHIGCTYPL
jgi:hypothetical protein